jgi:hypothetical protein
VTDLEREKEEAEEKARHFQSLAGSVGVSTEEALVKIRMEKDEIEARLKRRTDSVSAQQHEITRLKTSYQVCDPSMPLPSARVELLTNRCSYRFPARRGEPHRTRHRTRGSHYREGRPPSSAQLTPRFGRSRHRAAQGRPVLHSAARIRHGVRDFQRPSRRC